MTILIGHLLLGDIILPMGKEENQLLLQAQLKIFGVPLEPGISNVLFYYAYIDFQFLRNPVPEGCYIKIIS